MNKKEFWIALGVVVVIMSIIVWVQFNQTVAPTAPVVLNPSSYTAQILNTDNSTYIELTFPNGVELKADTSYIVTIPQTDVPK